MKYKPRRDLVKFATEYRTLKPTDLKDIILKKRNKDITAESITMWFKRNPEVYAALKATIIQEELPKIEVHESIFAK